MSLLAESSMCWGHHLSVLVVLSALNEVGCVCIGLDQLHIGLSALDMDAGNEYHDSTSSLDMAVFMGGIAMTSSILRKFGRAATSGNGGTVETVRR